MLHLSDLPCDCIVPPAGVRSHHAALSLWSWTGPDHSMFSHTLLLHNNSIFSLNTRTHTTHSHSDTYIYLYCYCTAYTHTHLLLVHNDSHIHNHVSPLLFFRSNVQDELQSTAIALTKKTFRRPRAKPVRSHPTPTTHQRSKQLSHGTARKESFNIRLRCFHLAPTTQSHCLAHVTNRLGHGLAN